MIELSWKIEDYYCDLLSKFGKVINAVNVAARILATLAMPAFRYLETTSDTYPVRSGFWYLNIYYN